MTSLKPKFGLTNPVAKLAEEYKVPFQIAASYVDMAWVDSGLREREVLKENMRFSLAGISGKSVNEMSERKYVRFLKDCARIVQDCIRAAQ